MKKKRGDLAPDFVVRDDQGRELNSRDFRGTRWLLSFFRYAGCPLCNMRVHDLSERYEDWQTNGFRWVAVFESDRESIQKRVGREKRPFPLVPDPERHLYRQFGVESSWFKFVKGGWPVLLGMFKGYFPGKMEGDIAVIPADFLIDEEGRIATAFYGQHIGDHLPVAEIESFINKGK